MIKSHSYSVFTCLESVKPKTRTSLCSILITTHLECANIGINFPVREVQGQVQGRGGEGRGRDGGLW